MILLPYYITEKKLPIGCTLTTLWLFLASGGTDLWKVDEEHVNMDRSTIVQEYMVENGLHGELRTSPEPYLVYKVDTHATNMKEFHTWSDILAGQSAENVWRPFFWIGDGVSEKDAWGWKEEADTLKVGFYSMGDVWKVLRGSTSVS